MSLNRYALIGAILVLAASLSAAVPIAGTWALTSVDPDGNPIRATLTITEVGGRLTGAVTVEDMALGMTDPSMSGDTFTCKVTHEGRAYDVKLKVSGDSLEGAWESPGNRKGGIKGKRTRS